jgi:SAM-dependent methyltransferase
MTEREYLLGTGDDELTRLALQNRLWGDVSAKTFRRAQLKMGHRALDVGCGPGFAAFDIADIVTRYGSVFGVDESPAFIEHANEQAQARGIQHFAGAVGDVQELDEVLSDQEPFDFAYARWVLCFIADPEAAVRGIANALAPGGRVAIHDYFDYSSMTLAPRRRSHDLAVEATSRSWIQRGGDPDVGQRLPAMLERCGLRLESVRAHLRVARGSDTMFAWPNTWWHTFAPKLVAMGELAQSDCDELIDDLKKIENGEGFVQCPTVYEFIATKVG